MIKELWHSFPRVLEQKINGLLDVAEPNQAKAFQLYKACQRDGLWHESFEKFSDRIASYFSTPKLERRKSDLDQILDRPIDSVLYADFHLNFHNALVDNRSVLNIVSWAHNLMRVSIKTNSVVISLDVLTRTLHYITNPPLFEKAQDITFEDFCDAWKKIVFRLFGKVHDAEFTRIMNELQWLNTQLQESEKSPVDNSFFPTIYLTQTEIDWVNDVQLAVSAHLPAPKFPLSKGPQKQRLIDLERALRLYKIVQTSKLPDFVQHRENIRATILDRCEKLLQERAR
ncbi:hypothetical protein [uncultured Bdellovibrio sp.]|uniref:hypothetical protein n=1 Tax=Bdellovibrio sp. HCB-162 TaxID=3394234 RepID=UPI0025CD17C5|nr:hypothetical protein [uncultured Bdellovibrio sp.]